MTHRTLLLLTTALMLAMSGAARAAVIADAFDDFEAGTSAGEQADGIPDTDGSGEWEYYDSDAVKESNNTDRAFLEWDTTDNRYELHSGTHTGGGLVLPIVASAGSNQTLLMHPGGGSDEYAVVRWISGVAGSVDIVGDLSTNSNSSDGVTFDILHNDTNLLSATNGADSSAPFDFTRSVSAGDEIDFVVGNNGSTTGDSSFLDATMTVIPEPGSLALLAPAGLLALRRRRA